MEHVQPQEQRLPNPVTRKLLAVVAGGTLLLTAGCSSSETEATPRPEVSVTSEYTAPTSEVTTPVVVEGDGDPSNDKDSADMAVYYADHLKMDESDKMQARIDDPTIATESRLAVDGEEAEWVQYYKDNGRTQEAQAIQDRIGK